MNPRRQLAAITLAMTLSIVGLVWITFSANAAAWWQPGQITAWAYMIGYNQPITVPSFISSPTGVHPNTAVDVDLGDDAGLASNGMPTVDPNVVQSVSNIHAAGAHAICYVDVGTAENWRSDYSLFDPSEIGSAVPGWSGEYFINVNDWSTPVPAPYETIQQIMTNRFELCQEEGFDGIEADNVDTYTDGNLGGFTISQSQEETYVNNLISLAHSDGLAYFLKNEINGDSFISDEAAKVDGEIVEQCWQYGECSALDIFVQEGKPILNVEYDSPSESTLCPEANAFPMASNSENVDVTEINYSCSEYGNGEAPEGATTTTTSAPSTPPSTTPSSTTPSSTTPSSTTSSSTTSPSTTSPSTTPPGGTPPSGIPPSATPPSAAAPSTIPLSATPPTTEHHTTKPHPTKHHQTKHHTTKHHTTKHHTTKHHATNHHTTK